MFWLQTCHRHRHEPRCCHRGGWLGASHKWYCDLEPKQAADVVNLCLDDDKDYVKCIDRSQLRCSCESVNTVHILLVIVNANADQVRSILWLQIVVPYHALPASRYLLCREKPEQWLATSTPPSIAIEGGVDVASPVDRADQGKGLGGLLLQAAEERARKCVLGSNEPAKKCYARAGFNVCSSRRSQFPPCSCGAGPCGHKKMHWLEMQNCTK